MIGLELIVKMKNMEFKDVASYLEISPQTVSDWIKGKRRVPPKRAEQLSDFWGIDAELISKVIEEEDMPKIYYQVGSPFEDGGPKKRIFKEDLEAEENNGGESDLLMENQLALELESDNIKNKGTIKDLEDQIKEGRAEVKADEIDMTISELANMYSGRKVIDIHPEFQRLFRWTMAQKSKLIESILLGIPIPPLFVAEDMESAWDVIDGVQRLSTIFEFLGILRDEEEKLVEPSILVGTEKLKALEGKVWDKSFPGFEHRFSFQDGTGLQNKFLYSKLKIIRVSNESNPNAKYDIFDRLNTGGSKLTHQEVRNCLAIMINREFYAWLRKLSLNPDFIACAQISEKALSEQADLEYVLRFIVYRHITKEEYSSTDDINEVLTKKMKEFCLKDNLDFVKEKEIFDKTFALLLTSLGKNSFKKYFSNEERFKGQMMLSSFEIIAIGIANNIERISNLPDPSSYIEAKVKALYDSTEYKVVQKIISGRAVTRFSTLIELGTNYFSN
ncbi:GmrSD restriction endonuclease domain-containing protein [Bacillus toyonensis]|uniref:GmrSD restriction endonuclease domain-containing protein n=1 Tax=Bacillus toyonensis TaxID=155322 RepID=UPI000BEB9DB0|nr:DUF262 domain-containing protein [Bacillus toyonensis]PDY52291.1 hypothetical protein CON61_15900 [Bacillus toyonensis]